MTLFWLDFDVLNRTSVPFDLSQLNPGQQRVKFRSFSVSPGLPNRLSPERVSQQGHIYSFYAGWVETLLLKLEMRLGAWFDFANLK